MERKLRRKKQPPGADDATLLMYLDAWRGQHFAARCMRFSRQHHARQQQHRHRDFLARHFVGAWGARDAGYRFAPSGRPHGRSCSLQRSAACGDDSLRLVELCATAPRSANSVSISGRRGVDRRFAPRHLCATRRQRRDLLAVLSLPVLSGMLTGFADLIFTHDGHYHVLHLQDELARQSSGRLRKRSVVDAAMTQHHYPLQALIYTVALHRYLREASGRLYG